MTTEQLADLLIEIHTEELPPKNLLNVAEFFAQEVHDRLQKIALSFKAIQFYVSPRHLAVLVTELASEQATQTIERRGPALNAAYDVNGNPTQALQGFLKSAKAQLNELRTIKTAQGEWVGLTQHVAGKKIQELIPTLVTQALASIPMKRMRWGNGAEQFARPVHSVILLYGDDVIPASILGCQTNRITRGHRFLAPDWITIPNASHYATLLEEQGKVMVDFIKRRAEIMREATSAAKNIGAEVLISSDALLNEVTGLVESPHALCGRFDAAFLSLPPEVLISAMQDHQRYFPVVDQNKKLLPAFITISNLPTDNPAAIIHGNERVIRARLADAAFFFNEDKKATLASRLPRLKTIVFQGKLGTQYDRAERLSLLGSAIATRMNMNATHLARAGMLAKTDLTTHMVNEFPELQGVMGGYYALHDQEERAVVDAIKEHYLPRYALDQLPHSKEAQALALADRIDMLVGSFGTEQIPTGDKDPYGLRRAALGTLRILIEKQINLDLPDILSIAASNYKTPLTHPNLIADLQTFFQERLRAWYAEKAIAPDVFAAVAAVTIANPMDFDQRLHAVQAFKKLPAAETLSVANKRVSNILAKYEEKIAATDIDPTYFEHDVEAVLANALNAKSTDITRLLQAKKYNEMLVELSTLRQPIDDFFAEVMVMTDDKSRRENRLLMLHKLRALFLQVADIALLQ